MLLFPNHNKNTEKTSTEVRIPSSSGILLYEQENTNKELGKRKYEQGNMNKEIRTRKYKQGNMNKEIRTRK